MKIKKLFLLSLLMAMGIFLKSDSAFAAVKTWDGGGSDDNLATAANWDADTAPVSGDSVVFPLGVLFPSCTAVELVNDLNASSVTLAGVSTTGTRPASCYEDFVISGNELKTSGNIAGPDSGNIIMEAALTATADITISKVDINGNFAIGAHSVTFGDYVDAANGAVTGSGSLTFNGLLQGGRGGGCGDGTTTSVPFTGDASGFTGAIVISADSGISIGGGANSFGRSARSITLNGGFINFSLSYGEGSTLDVPLELHGGLLRVSQSDKLVGEDCVDNTTRKTFTLSGEANIYDAIEVATLRNANLSFSGPINGQEKITVAEGQDGEVSFADGTTLKSSTKVITIDNTENCGDAYNANSINTLLVIKVDCSGSWTSSAFESAGTIKGNGKLGMLKILSGGILAPGLSPGCLGSNDLTFVEGASFEAELGGRTVCAEYDQQQVTGTVTLGNATLNVLPYNKYKLVAGSKFVIISNDGSDAIAGTFKNLAEGATFKLSDGAVLKISYVGGDGNDVELTVITASTPDTGFALLFNNPAAILAATTLSAGALLYLSRRMNFSPRRVRR